MFWSHFNEKANFALLSKVGFIPQWSKQVADPMGHASHQFVLSIRHSPDAMKGRGLRPS